MPRKGQQAARFAARIKGLTGDELTVAIVDEIGNQLERIAGFPPVLPPAGTAIREIANTVLAVLHDRPSRTADSD